MSIRAMLSRLFRLKQKSPYRDSQQIGVDCHYVYEPGQLMWRLQWSAHGVTRNYVPLIPRKIIATQSLVVTFQNEEGGIVQRAMDADNLPTDDTISGFWVDAENWLPHLHAEPPQHPYVAVPLGRFWNHANNPGLRLPRINAKQDIRFDYTFDKSVLKRVTPPAGFTCDDITKVEVMTRINVFGTKAAWWMRGPLVKYLGWA